MPHAVGAKIGAGRGIDQPGRIIGRLLTRVGQVDPAVGTDDELVYSPRRDGIITGRRIVGREYDRAVISRLRKGAGGKRPAT